MMTSVGEIRFVRNKNGSVRYVSVVRHSGLGLVQEVKGDDPHVVHAKAQGKARQWNERWQRKLASEEKRRAREARQAAAVETRQQKAALAAERQSKKDAAVEETTKAQAEWEAQSLLLEQALATNAAIDWSTLKDTSLFRQPQPPPPIPVEPPSEPVLRPEPLRTDSIYVDQPSLGGKLVDLLVPGRRAKRHGTLEAAFAEDHANWIRGVVDAEAAHQDRLTEYAAATRRARAEHLEAVARWKRAKSQFIEARAARNRAVDEARAQYEVKQPNAIEDYCDFVLDSSEYPDWCPKEWALEFSPDDGHLIVEYHLPDLPALPRLKQVRYIQARDEFTESFHSDVQVAKAYDSVVYQIALRTIHEVLEADVVEALRVVTFNGRVRSTDPATGHEVNACILSLQVQRDEFLAINLAAVKPKACVKKLKGVGSSKLHSITPVPPIAQIDTADARFVDSYEVATTLDEGENLAAMDWEDFEHLVREVFEYEFSAGGGQVKVTRASRDGGIDAVAFDPDPIRGGKIVIQAKRYTRTVGVAAVRDLYGAVMNEGANKGILVTTSSYGPDAYGFARDKPITLIDGGSLLHLLQKHGHRVRIDLAEARRETT